VVFQNLKITGLENRSDARNDELVLLRLEQQSLKAQLAAGDSKATQLESLLDAQNKVMEVLHVSDLAQNGRWAEFDLKIASLDARSHDQTIAQKAELDGLQSANLARRDEIVDLKQIQSAETERLQGAILDLRQSQNAELERLQRANIARRDEIELARQAPNTELDRLQQANIARRDEIDLVRQYQVADSEKTKALNLYAPRNSHGQNVFVGLHAGEGLATFENEAGADPSLGSQNSALGHGALAFNKTGGLNTAIGVNALALNEDGSNNLAAGANALAWNKSGKNNVALGSGALFRNLTGTHNTAVGVGAIYQLQNGGHHNSAFGRDSLFSLTKGSWNAAFGVDAMPGLEVGDGNSAFGGEAGYTEITDGQHRLGSFNSWFGYQSGPASIKQVSNSIAIGYRAKNTESNQTVIGNEKTAETLIRGEVKVSKLCIGDVCADAAAFEAMLKANETAPKPTETMLKVNKKDRR